DGRPLTVTVRNLADELAAAADLVKGKSSGVPAALVRGVPGATAQDVPARALSRTGADDWFRRPSLESVWVALGLAPEQEPIARLSPEPAPARIARALQVAALPGPRRPPPGWPPSRSRAHAGPPSRCRRGSLARARSRPSPARAGSRRPRRCGTSPPTDRLRISWWRRPTTRRPRWSTPPRTPNGSAPRWAPRRSARRCPGSRSRSACPILRSHHEPRRPPVPAHRRAAAERGREHRAAPGAGLVRGGRAHRAVRACGGELGDQGDRAPARRDRSRPRRRGGGGPA